uniref:Ankyrin repeat and SOCS box containing 10 n=1 Tax=Electrophorus electricus TaxID=8005 RepID=A0A4W4DRV6_ELEEL
MSQRSFAFTPAAIRSLEEERDLLERQRHQRRVLEPRLTCYLLRKEARERSAQSSMTAAGPPTPLVCRDLVVQNALFTGDMQAMKELFPIEAKPGVRRWMVSRLELDAILEQGIRFWLWSLTYEQELTTPLHITAGRGFTDCLRHLLLRGASVDFAPGGSTPLHEACEACQPDCVKLLLQYGANANATSEDGLMPLHVCTELESLECAKQLLQFGAAISGRSLEENDTPLHVAARHGLPEHVALYLRYGGVLEHQNDEGLTPLNAACSQPQEHSTLEQGDPICSSRQVLNYSSLRSIRTVTSDLHLFQNRWRYHCRWKLSLLPGSRSRFCFPTLNVSCSNRN